MKGLFVCLLVIVTVTAVRSQGPATRTKKGKRPTPRNDNPDIGLPSGADVPDGRRFVGVPPIAATKPAVRPATRPAARPAAVPAANQIATKTRSGPPPQGRRNDNPDFGLPSGRDFPDAGMGRQASAPAARPAANTASAPATMPVAARPAPMPAAASRPAPMTAAARPAPMPAAARPAQMPTAAIPATNAASSPIATMTRSGPPPTGRRNDNPDFGLPSGRDFPDAGMGRQASVPAAIPAARSAVSQAAGPASMPAGRPVVAPAATITRSGPPPPGRRNDNPDFGLPSGRDFPDAGMGRPATAPAARPAVVQAAGPAPMQAGNPALQPAATMARSGPPPPGRRNDNPDFGLPSGRDFPDAGMGRPAAAPAARPVASPAAGPAPMQAGNPALAPGATMTRSGPPPPGRRNDNPDFGLPSGRDFPDAGRGRPVAAPAAIPAAGPTPLQDVISAVAPADTMTRSGPPPQGRLNDNPDFGLPSGRDFPDAGMAPVPNPVPFNPPVAPAVPAGVAAVFDCALNCPTDYLPVCTISGSEYDNDCYRQCTGEVLDCDSPCPCNVEPTPPTPDPMVPAWDDCTFSCPGNNDPVCVEGEEFKNECFARCSGHDQFTCSSSCPC